MAKRPKTLTEDDKVLWQEGEGQHDPAAPTQAFA